MEKESKDGLMVLFTTENTMKVKNMEEELFSGVTIQCSLESLKTTILKVMELTNGTTDENIMVIGKTTKCTVKESSHGQMEGNTSDPTKKT